MITEIYRCPITGDSPNGFDRWRAEYKVSSNAILIPGKRLPKEITDEQAVHECAMTPYNCGWKRIETGEVIIWVEM